MPRHRYAMIADLAKRDTDDSVEDCDPNRTLARRDPARKFERAAALSYDGVELSAGADTNVVALEREAAAASAESGLPVAAVCTAGGMDSLASGDDERALRFAKLTEIMAMVESLGASGVISVPHRPARGFASRGERQDWIGQLMLEAEHGYGDWARTPRRIVDGVPGAVEPARIFVPEPGRAGRRNR